MSDAEQAAHRDRMASWRRYCANPTAENRRRYFEVDVPRWQKAIGRA